MDKAQAIKHILEHIGDGITYEQAKELIKLVLDQSACGNRNTHADQDKTQTP